MQSVHRSLRLLEEIALNQPIGVTELARSLGFPKSSAHRMLMTLAEAGWIQPSSEDRTKWTVSIKARQIGQLGDTEVDLREAALVPMQVLRDATQETVHFQVPVGNKEVALIQRVDCLRSVRTFLPLGASSPTIATSTGRAMLAFRSEDAINEVLADPPQAYTEYTITEQAALIDELSKIKHDGYSVNYRQNRPDVCAVGAPVFSPSGPPMAAVCISMPHTRFDPDKVPQWAALVMKAAEQVSEGTRTP